MFFTYHLNITFAIERHIFCPWPNWLTRGASGLQRELRHVITWMMLLVIENCDDCFQTQ